MVEQRVAKGREFRQVVAWERENMLYPKKIVSKIGGLRNIRMGIREMLVRFPINVTKPTMLTLRWGESDLPNSVGLGAKKSLAEFQQLIAEFVQHSGPFSVRILAMENANDPDIPKLLRFAHRLDCLTELVVNGENITQENALDLVGSGVQKIWITIGGVSAHVHRLSTGLDIEQTTLALRYLLTAAKEHHPENPTSIGVLVPWEKESPTEMSAIRSWVEEIGVAQVHILFPFFGKNLAKESLPQHQYLSKMLEKILQDDSDKPGWSRKDPLFCPVGNKRLEVSKTGKICSCPFKTSIAWQRESFVDIWQNLADHRKEISNCNRVCLHRELQSW